MYIVACGSSQSFVLLELRIRHDYVHTRRSAVALPRAKRRELFGLSCVWRHTHWHSADLPAEARTLLLPCCPLEQPDLARRLNSVLDVTNGILYMAVLVPNPRQRQTMVITVLQDAAGAHTMFNQAMRTDRRESDLCNTTAPDH